MISGYRRGAVFGLTVAEIFILFTFLLLIALTGFTQKEETLSQPNTPPAPRVWMRPEEIQALVSATEEARRKREEAELARLAAERERDQAQEKAEEVYKKREEAELARLAAERERDQAQEKAEEVYKKREEAELTRLAAERERDQAQEKAEEMYRKREEAELARLAVERERDQAQEKAEEMYRKREEAELARLAVERERDQARKALASHRKGERPPCWYTVVPTSSGKTREKREYVFDVAIYEKSIVLAPKAPPPRGAFDDGGRTYVEEWERLEIENMPYGKKLTDKEFDEAVKDLVAQGRNKQVRTYECVFSVRVWDKTPIDAKQRWKDAHDNLIERSFNAYTVQDLEWTGVK